jgi:hypothetical protein
MTDPLKTQNLDSSERVVWDYLDANCRGRAAAQTLERIAEALQMPRRLIHDLCAQLVRSHALPIASACADPMGMFVAETVAEKTDYREQLKGRLREIYQRYKAFGGAPVAGFEQLLLFAP